MRERRTKEIISHSSADGSRLEAGLIYVVLPCYLHPPIFFLENADNFTFLGQFLLKGQREDATKERGKRAIVNRYGGGTLKEGKGR